MGNYKFWSKADDFVKDYKTPLILLGASLGSWAASPYTKEYLGDNERFVSQIALAAAGAEAHKIFWENRFGRKLKPFEKAVAYVVGAGTAALECEAWEHYGSQPQIQPLLEEIGERGIEALGKEEFAGKGSVPDASKSLAGAMALKYAKEAVRALRKKKS